MNILYTNSGSTSDRFATTLGLSSTKVNKSKVRAEEKAYGIAPNEKPELDNLLDTIIALEESADTKSQEVSTEKAKKLKVTEQKQKM